MSFDTLSDLNWIAVLIAALAYFALGAIWYAPPVMGKVWIEAGGAQMGRADGDARPGPGIYLVPALGSLLSAIALAMLVEASETDSASEGLVLGLVVGVGFAISIALVTATFETTKPKPMVWGAVNAGYHLLGNLVAAVIIAAWQ